MSDLIERLRSDGADCCQDDLSQAADELERLTEQNHYLTVIGKDKSDRIKVLEGVLLGALVRDPIPAHNYLRSKADLLEAIAAADKEKTGE